MRKPLAVMCAFLLALAAACGGDDSPGNEDALLADTSFREVVAAELESAGFEAEQAFGGKLEIYVNDGPNRVDVALAEQFAEYEKNPERRDEIVSGIVDDTRRRLEQGIAEDSFADVESDLMPVLKPRFAVRKYDEAPAATPFPAALSVVYAVDRGNEYTIVTPGDLRRWGKTVDEVHEVALDNLLRQTNAEEKLSCEPSEGSELCGWASEDGYDATRMIVPELRRQIERVYDGDPAMYAVPTEGVFVALPLAIATRQNNEKLLKTKVERDFATAEENPLSPELFVERDGKLVVF